MNIQKFHFIFNVIIYILLILISLSGCVQNKNTGDDLSESINYSNENIISY